MNKLVDPVEEFLRLWTSGALPDLSTFIAAVPMMDLSQLSILARIDQEQRWQRGDRRSAEEYLQRYPIVEADPDATVDLIYHEYLLREKFAEQPSLEEFVQRFPQHATELAEQVKLHRAFIDVTEGLQDDSTAPGEQAGNAPFGNSLLPKLPAQFGRYRALKLLGCGGMGTVYLAEDLQLGRRVALKLPRFDQGISPDVLDRFRREAQIAATFHHPNLCPVYDFGEVDGTLFLTMPYMTGQPLSTRLQAGRLPEKEAVRVALEIARAMSVAHRAGVVHRDLKPSNIVLGEDGAPVVMDFGLARRGLDLDPKLTGTGTLLGTLAYMAPEYIRSPAHEASPVGDVYSLGVILYEMLVGRPPFIGTWQQTWEQVHHHVPPAPSQLVPGLSSHVDRVCLQALAKDPRERISSMEVLADALAKKLAPLAEQKSRQVTDVDHRRAALSEEPRSLGRFLFRAVAISSIVMVLGWMAWQLASARWAREQLPVIQELAKAHRYYEAYDLAVRARPYLSSSTTFAHTMKMIADSLNVTTQPAGARVDLKRSIAESGGETSQFHFVGETPLTNREVARGRYIVRIEKDGCVPFQGTWTGLNYCGVLDAPIVPESSPVNVKLISKAQARPGMVLVPGGIYSLVAWARPTAGEVALDDYFIDQCEVTNREYKDFVEAGGYLEERFWTEPFVREGRSLSWEEAMQEFRDTTSAPGPRGWSNGTFAEGQENHPVTGVTWYEAMAYAAFRGKTLPTIFQWEKAARNGEVSVLGLVMPWGLYEGSTDGLANFSGRGTVPVGSLDRGISPFCCYEMAGNVAEWCLNDSSEGFMTCGGSWASRVQGFAAMGPYPSFHTSDQLGFRCVMNSETGPSDQGAKYIKIDDEVPTYTPATQEEVKAYLTNFEYDKAAPLEVRSIDHKDNDLWTQEKIAYRGADGEEALAYLYLPKHFPPPHQVIHFVAAGDVTVLHRPLPTSIEDRLMPFVLSGRGVFSVVLRGYPERLHPVAQKTPSSTSPESSDRSVQHIVDLRRGLDYLEMRDDVDMSKIAFMFESAGGTVMALPGIDSRYAAVVIQGGAVGPFDFDGHPETNPIHFIPLIQAPKLLIHGRYDEFHRLNTHFEPLLNLCTGITKKKVYEGGHVQVASEFVPLVNTFLNAYLGPVVLRRDVGPLDREKNRH